MAIKSRSSMMTPRKRSKVRIRGKISGISERPRVSVFRSSKHIYAQLVVDSECRTIASASTLDQEVLGRLKVAVAVEDGAVSSKSVAAARIVGLVFAERCKGAGVNRVVFDRNGFEYWGRIRALAEGARDAGLIF
jgi:large subunit ribosomal protein L18